ncbi:peptidoglycan hydrolase-like protein with peptidoglycan-binding domain [Tamaricihabitans halophyticus]|uniref:Peptidoglycan hydrolase-like protein with peptidoglycan-binding domain n=1 Tax=Tamaricihabitans halophyticus TaxID=1262583 RepID=A0A4R2R2V0_9PSEU|nr:peptidoglycan-binding protein [Tamaricihabitans halophyticus]TCP57100.1 peptidoglycan hydrolase-like protein with peptidoglycan-binding domain [Tamaricihabitans halophyticus]
MRKALAGLAAGVLLAGAVAAFTGPQAGTAAAAPTPQPTASSSSAAPPSASELSDAVADCTEQVSNGKYAERSGQERTIPICATGNAVHWRSGMTIVCDGQATDKCNSSTDPWWQEGTAWPQSDGKPLNAEKLPFVVVPISSSIWDHADSEITGGTVVAAVYKDKVAYAVVGDRGPDDAIGEGSYALAEALGIDPDPASGGVAGKVVDYIAFPRVESSPIEDNADAVAKGEEAAADLVAGRIGCISAQLGFTNYDELSDGANGNKVRAAQCLLRTAGADDGQEAPSGEYDKATADAVTKFQEQVGLDATGKVDSKTWTALLSFGDTPQVGSGASGEAVGRVQRALNAAISAGIDTDRQFGSKTAEAVKEYQSKQGLDADGIVGKSTWEALQAGK